MPSLDTERTGDTERTDEAKRKPNGPSEEPRAVHVRFSPREGRRLRRPEPKTCGDGRPLWAERPLLIKRADGTYELIGTSRNLAGLARWVLSFGTGAKACGPDRLRRQVALRARRIWQKYADD